MGSRGRTPSAGSFGALIITGLLAVVFLVLPTVAILVALLVLLVIEWAAYPFVLLISRRVAPDQSPVSSRGSR